MTLFQVSGLSDAARSMQLRLQMLRPAGVKLTSVDSLRVIGSIEDAIQKSELMACIEDAINFTVGGGPLCTALGADIVAELERYKVRASVYSLRCRYTKIAHT